MEGFRKISPKEIADNVFKMIGDDWFLTCAGTMDDFNMMTCSWGGLGHIWEMDVATVVIRPQRHTYGYTEKGDYYTVCVFGEEYRKALAFCGGKSGRDYDKAKETGLTPIQCGETIAFKEARLVLLCRKVYTDMLKKECFVDQGIAAEHYPAEDFHRAYVGEIVGVYTK